MSATQNRIAALLQQRNLNFSLRVLLPLSLLFSAGALMAYLIPVTLNATQQRTIQEITGDITRRGSSLQTQIEPLLKIGKLDLVQTQFSALGVQPEISLALLTDETGKILASMRQELSGRKIEEVVLPFPLDFSRSAESARRTMSGTVNVMPEQQQISAVYPVQFDTSTTTIRPSRIGLVLLQYDTRLPLAQARAEAVSWLVKIGLLTLALALLTGALLYLAITRRIDKLLRATARVARGDFSTVSGVRGKDEIGRLGEVFDMMTRELELTADSLHESEDRYRAMFEQASDSMLLIDVQTKEVVQANRRFELVSGYSGAALTRLKVYDLLDEPGQEIDTSLARIVADGGLFLGERKIKRLSGELLPVEINTAVISLNHRTYIMAGVHDISARKQNLMQLMLASTVFENSSEAIMITDADNNILSVNQAFTDITGYTPQEVLGQNPRLLQSHHMQRDFYREMWDALKTGHRWSGEILDRRKDGEVFPKWMTLTSVENEAGAVSHYIAIFSDISERKIAEEKMRHQAEHDYLTNLPNRVLLFDRLSQAITLAERHGNKVALLFLDLDRFKNVNDSLGHHIGDQLLLQVTQRLIHCVRSSDTVSRQGGDEFIVLLPEVDNSEAAALLAGKLLETLARPYTIDGTEVHLTTSIGICLYPDDGQDITTLIKHADTAMYHAKESGRNNYQFFTSDMNVRAAERMSLETKLRRALERGELLLHYQPQVDLQRGCIIGMEALIRWRHPELGLVSPAKFIPIAEECGLIVPIGEWVLHEACRQNRAWQQSGLPAVSVAVNLSALQFHQANLTQTVTHALSAAGLDPCHLELELTESIIMQNEEKTLATLSELKAMGVKLAIDDFGTGYSSLSYLKRFAINRLKIDQSFIRDIPQDADDATITQAIIGLAKSLKLSVIAEGVESKEQLAFLLSHQCDEMQGYYFSKPLPAEECTQLLQANPRLADCLLAGDL